MLVASYHPAEDWGGLIQDYGEDVAQRNWPPPIRITEPASRPTPHAAPSSGELGPGAYHLSEALLRPSVAASRFSKADRFRDATLDVEPRGSSPPSSPLGEEKRGHGMRRIRSETQLVQRLRLGRPEGSTCPPTFAARESDVMVRGDAAVPRSTTPDLGELQRILRKQVGCHRPAERRPPVYGHPGSAGRSEHQERQREFATQTQPRARSIRKLRLFGEAAPGTSRRRLISDQTIGAKSA